MQISQQLPQLIITERSRRHTHAPMAYPLRNLLVAGRIARQKAAVFADGLQAWPLHGVGCVRRMAAGTLLLEELRTPRLLRRPLLSGLRGRQRMATCQDSAHRDYPNQGTKKRKNPHLFPIIQTHSAAAIASQMRSMACSSAVLPGR